MFIFTAKNKAKHDQTPLDIYFSSLEEAYGNLPVPSDDWAGVKKKLETNWTEKEVRHNLEDLEKAIDTIRQHYVQMAFVLGKEVKFG